MASDWQNPYATLPPSIQKMTTELRPDLSTIANKGSLVTFFYNYWKNDPKPLVIITDVFNDIIRGINLHYLTPAYIRVQLQQSCDNRSFSYANFKTDSYIVQAFRSYKRSGIQYLHKIDCSFLQQVLKVSRTINPAEVEQIRQKIHEMMNNPVLPEAEATPVAPKI